MLLVGLVIGIGMMVDGVVVMVENVYCIMVECKVYGGLVDCILVVLVVVCEVVNLMVFVILIIIVVFLLLFSL